MSYTVNRPPFLSPPPAPPRLWQRWLHVVLALIAMTLAGIASAQAPQSRFTDANGVRMHYLVAGQGEPVILLHGYAETSHMWLPLMKELAKNHLVIAPDLRGFGESSIPPTGYTKVTMAQDVHALAGNLKLGKVRVVGHDIGLMVAYAYAAQYPSEVDRIVLMDAFLPGVGNWKDVWLLRDLWHFHFYGKTPLELVAGRERIYFEHFWNDFAADASHSIPEADRKFYAKAYGQPGRMRAGFEVFRAFEQDAADFAQLARTPLPMPMLVLGGEKASGDTLIVQARLIATNVEGVVIKGSGHWLMEEATSQVVPRLVDFLNKPYLPVASASASASAFASTSGSAARPAFQSAAHDSAAKTRTAEDAKLVWTASSVALMSAEVAPGVFAVYPDDSSQKNAAGIPAATSGGFIVGDNGVLVIESMLNRQLANQMLALVRERTNKPITYLVNTSYHGDHSYGNQFFPKGVQIIQHVETQAYIQSHFTDDVAFMKQFFGADQGMNELKPQPAQLLLHDNAMLDIDLGGKRVQIMHLGFAQTVGDLFVWLPAEKVLYTGNPIISDGPSLPWLLDGKLDASLATMRKLRAMLPADAVVIPGHGEPTGVVAIDYPIAYLEELKRKVVEAVGQGLTEEQTVARLATDMRKYDGYKIFPWVHSQINVPKTYQEIVKAK